MSRPESSPTNLLLFGTFESERVPRIEVLAEGLADNGFRVDSMIEPLGMPPDERLKALSSPLGVLRFAAKLLIAWSKLVGQRLRYRQRPDVVLVGYMAHFDVVLARALFWRSTIVIDHLVSASDTARDRRASPPVVWALQALDAVALTFTDIALVDTVEHARFLPDRWQPKGVVVPVGAQRHWFETRPLEPAEELRVVFFGIFTPLQGTTVIAEAIERLRARSCRISFTMIGTGQDYDQARSIVGDNASVTWIDWVAPSELAAVVADHHVCLGIFAGTPKAVRVVPQKVYIGAAAGRVIVTSDTAPQRHSLGEAAIYVPVDDPESLAAALERLATQPDQWSTLSDAVREVANSNYHPAQVTMPLVERLCAPANEGAKHD